MGKKDDAIVPFFKDKERFSDLFNGALFHRLFLKLYIIYPFNQSLTSIAIDNRLHPATNTTSGIYILP